MQTLTTRRWTQTVEHDHAKVERLVQGVALQDYSTVAQNDQVVYAGLILPSLPRDDGKCSYITPAHAEKRHTLLQHRHTKPVYQTS